MAGIVSIQEQLTQLASGEVNNVTSIQANATNNYEAITITLANGANTIAVPTWAVGCIIRPNPLNAVAMTLKGVTGDTGIPLDLTGPSLINFPATPPATFVLTSTGAGATVTTIEFF